MNNMLWGPFTANGHDLNSSRIVLFQEYQKNVFEAIHTYKEHSHTKSHTKIVPNRIIYFESAKRLFDFLKDEQFLGDPKTLTFSIPKNHEELRTQRIEKDKRTFNSLPIEVREAIKNENTLVYVDHSIEGWDNILFDRVCEIFNIPKERLVWITSIYRLRNKPPFTEVKSLYYNFWEHNLHTHIARDKNNERMFEQQIQHSLDLKPRQKLCTSYMRRRRHARMTMAMLLKENDLLKDMYWSLGTLVDGNRELKSVLRQLDYIVSIVGKSHPGLLNKDTIDWAYSIDKNITCDDNTLDTNLALGFLTWEHIFDTKFMLVNETIPGNLVHNTSTLRPFLSEKIYKPFAAGQMFLVHGCAGTVAAIKEKGYKTFDGFINHSYDNELCPTTRASMIAKEMKRLSQIPEDVWLKHLRDIVPQLRYNYDHFINCNPIVTTSNNGW